MLGRYLSRMRAKEACPPRKPLHKVIWSWIGSFLGIFLISVLAQSLETGAELFLIGSFGASAVLVYGAPTAEFSQPRNLVGGHVVSAFAGVSAFMLLGDALACAAVAVSASVVLMHLSKTMHPPGGATALIAVIGGEKVHALGYGYLLSPVLAGSLVMLAVALAVNNISADPRRHYPRYWL